ncbi:MAG: hypothetical protein K6A73_08110 [Bacteroidales bacterium]|nr:hypothetical protein [Bacteroidales bacterium]
MVRNTFDFDNQEKSEFWYTIKDTFGGMDELSSNERNKVRRAFQIFDYKLVDKELLREQAYPIAKATFDDYKVTDREMSEAVFNEYLDHCARNNYDYWGAFDKKTQKMVGFCAVHVFDNSCEYGVIGFLPGYKHNASYPYYGFFYKMNEYYLDNQKFKYVSDGSRSITEHSNIQPFLEQNFNFRKAYCKLKVRYKWWFGAIVHVLLPFRKLIWNRNVRAVLNMHRMQL